MEKKSLNVNQQIFVVKQSVVLLFLLMSRIGKIFQGSVILLLQKECLRLAVGMPLDC